MNLKTIGLDGSHLIEASAGTGKTTALCLLYLRLLFEKRLLPENILAVTFTQAATLELKARIYEKLQKIKAWTQGKPVTFDDTDLHPQEKGDEDQGVIRKHLAQALQGFDRAAIYTVHGFCRKVLAESPLETGCHFSQSLIEDDERLLQPILDDFWRKEVLKGAVKLPPKTNIKSPDDLLDAAKRLLNYPEEAILFGSDELCQFWQGVYAFCRKEGRARHERRQELGFHDLLFNVYDAIGLEEGAEALAAAIGGRLRAMLVDEFQDTDLLQYRIFKKLQEKIPAAFFVGDPKQAIYGFRGADVFAYLAAKKDLPEENVHKLERNFRASQALMTGINVLFDKPDPFVIPGIGYTPLEARQAGGIFLGGKDYPALSFLWFDGSGPKKKNKDDTINKGNADEIAIRMTAGRIAKLLQEGEIKTDGGKKRVSAADIAVLVNNHDEAQAMARALEERKIASARARQANVFGSQEAWDLFIVISALLTPEWPLVRAALGTPFFGAAPDPGDEAMLEEETGRFLSWQHLWQRQGFAPMFFELMAEARVAENLLPYPDGKRRLANLFHLADLLQEESQSGQGMEELAAWFAQHLGKPGDEDSERFWLRAIEEEGKVRILTIHAAKGLEFPITFCPFAWKPTPFSRRQQPLLLLHPKDDPRVQLGLDNEPLRQEESLSEIMRLFYVAITRAKYACHILLGPVRNANQPKDHVGCSPLGWLLSQIDATSQPEAKNETALPCSGIHQVKPRLKALCEKINAQGGLAALEECPTDFAPSAKPAEHAPGKAEEEKRFQARSFCRRQVSPSFQIASFSALVRGKGPAEAADYDAQDAAEPGPLAAAEDFSDIAFFPKGPRTGECWHGIFEAIARGAADPRQEKDFLAYIRDMLALYGFSDAWAEAVNHMAQESLAAKLMSGSSGFALGEVMPSSVLPELEFTFEGSVKGEQLLDLPGLLDKGKMSKAFVRAAKSLSPQELSGFVRGFVDLLVRAPDNKFYIVDYKSNWLGNQALDYQGDRLVDAMAEHHYYLQYLIYMVAICRFLQSRGHGYDDFGGVFYLFLRGMAKGGGIYFHRPDKTLIEDLNRWFRRT